jgi:hypothetical protein
MFVYTNCKTEDDINFEHSSLNKIFGFGQDRCIDRVWFDNPISYLLKFQEQQQQNWRTNEKENEKKL